MKKMMLTTALVLACAIAAQAKDTAGNSATTPAPRDPNWVKRHDGFVETAKKGGVELLFLGDSITDGWRVAGKMFGQRIMVRSKPPISASAATGPSTSFGACKRASSTASSRSWQCS